LFISVNKDCQCSYS